jgi:hypothetical protein
MQDKISMLAKTVFGKEYKDKLDQKIMNNKLLWLFFLILISWNTIMLISLLDLKSTNHVKAQFPKTNYAEGTQEVGNDFANDAYFMSWGMYDILTNLSKFDKKDIRKKINEIANKMTAERYIEKKKEIDDFIKNVDGNSIKADFRIPNDEWHITRLKEKNRYGKEVVEVTANGDIFKKYGSNYTDPPKKCSYTISYFRKGGITYVENFGTDCF